MIDIVKIVTIGMVTAILSLVVKRNRPEIALCVSIVGGLTILFLLISPITAVIETITNLSSRMGIDYIYIQTVVKIIGIAYIIQFAAETARDTGEISVASKIELAGKVSIFIIASPIMLSLIDSVINLIP